MAGIAADFGVRLGLEPLNRFETDMVNTADDAMRLVNDIGSPHVGLSLDSFHMNIEEALAVAERVRPGQTWFTHLCHDQLHAELEPELPTGVAVAYDGLKLSI